MSLAFLPSLEISVLLNVSNIKQIGYIPDSMFVEAQETADLIANQGDTLLYGSNPGEAAKIFNKVARAIAVLSFQPGGFNGFDLKIESKFD